MSRIIILGASGLIGHTLFGQLSQRFGEVYAVLHSDKNRFADTRIFDNDRVVEHVDVGDFDLVRGVLTALKPTVILNCAGITKRRLEVNDPLQAIPVNALFPHRLAEWANERDIRVIHFSTDCVFDGQEGDYTERSPTTAKDAYGRTKALGEIDYGRALTIRSSFIGRELAVKSELLEWFLAQEGKTIRGFTQALYSGVSTLEMARIVGDIIADYPDLHGLYQLAMPDPISKFDLLTLARDAFDCNVEIVPESDFVSRPTLDGSRLRETMSLELPSWSTMMEELAVQGELAYPG